MLEHAYGLLDDAEIAALQTHVAACPGCTDALAENMKLQTLLRHAAKLDFPEVSFQAPSVEVAKPVAPMKSTWLPWMVAAGVLLLIGTPIASIYLTKPDRPTPERPDVAAIDQGSKPTIPPTLPGVSVPGSNMRDSPPKEWSATTNDAAKVKYTVLVIGPEKATQDKDNNYSITATDAAGSPLKVRVTVLAKDSKGGVHHKESFETDKVLKLPAGVWTKFPASGVNLHVLATHPTSQDKVEVVVPLK